MLGLFKSHRRKELLAAPFPEEWRAIIERNFPLYMRLPEEDRVELEGHIRIFIAEKSFEGCGGLELTDEIRVTIAAGACLLLLHRETDYYPDLRSILVYPSSYIAPTREHISFGVVIEGEDVRLGEAWTHGAVVLAWDAVKQGAADLYDGHNVLLHEFAHKLDQETGEANGAPPLEHTSMYVTWARVLGEAYNQLQRESRFGQPDVLDAYGATNPAEFFAVATESFFEKPTQLKLKHPELYEELAMYYQQDPERYLDDPASEPPSD